MEDKKLFPYTLMKEEIVISGISGRFPESDSTDEFRDNLFNHVDMITGDDRRWPKGNLSFISLPNILHSIHSKTFQTYTE